MVPGWSNVQGGPESFRAAAMAWTGRHVVVLGAAQASSAEGRVDAGVAYDARSRRWWQIEPPPSTGLVDPVAVWSGSEVVVATTAESVAFDPVANVWRTLPERPDEARHPLGVVWTGSEIVLIAHNQNRSRLLDQLVAVAYDPSTDSWRRLADPPLEMSYASVLWDGARVVLVGGFLDQNNRARSADGLATAQVYDPAGDEWSILGGLDLAPNALTAAVSPAGVHVWEYGLDVRLLGDRDQWVHANPAPFDFSECFPESVPAGGFVLGWYCGRGALYLPDTRAWVPIMVPTGGGDRLDMEALVAAGDAVFFWGDSSLWRFDPDRAATAAANTIDAGGGWAFTPIPELQWRTDPSLVWTGEELIVWGGHGIREEIYDGFAYAPESGGFHRIPAADHPGRFGQQAAWTGQEMVVWRGPISAWDPQRREWRSLTVPLPVGLVGGIGVEVWTGRDVLFLTMGGTESGGIAHDPQADRWRNVAPAPMRGVRSDLATGWSGRELYVWGGVEDSFWYQDGASYNPFTDVWRLLPPHREGKRLSGSVGAWSGREFLVIGVVGSESVNEPPHLGGIAFDPESDSWRTLGSLPLAFPDGADPPDSLLAVWVGGEVAVWLPAPSFGDTPQLGFYDPATDQWRLSASLPFAADASDIAFTGTHLSITTDAGLLVYETP